MKCFRCGKELDAYDVGCYQKLINRGAESFLCRDCLAKDLKMPRERMDELIRRFQKSGCALFPPLDFE